jgi:hypothetical protein
MPNPIFFLLQFKQEPSSFFSSFQTLFLKKKEKRVGFKFHSHLCEVFPRKLLAIATVTTSLVRLGLCYTNMIGFDHVTQVDQCKDSPCSYHASGFANFTNVNITCKGCDTNSDYLPSPLGAMLHKYDWLYWYHVTKGNQGKDRNCCCHA